MEPDDEVKPYLGTYACLFCSDSVQGKPALKCASAGTAAPSTIIAAIIEDAVPAVSGAVAAPDGAGQGARGGRADAESGGSGKGKEPAQAEAGPDAEAGGAATRGRAEGELVLSAAAARSRGTWTMAQQRLASAGRAAAEGVGEAAKRRSKQEEGSRGNVSTIGKGADAGSAEGGASASTIGEGAGARHAKQTMMIRCHRISRSSEFDRTGLSHTNHFCSPLF